MRRKDLALWGQLGREKHRVRRSTDGLLAVPHLKAGIGKERNWVLVISRESLNKDFPKATGRSPSPMGSLPQAWWNLEIRLHPTVNLVCSWTDILLRCQVWDALLPNKEVETHSSLPARHLTTFLYRSPDLSPQSQGLWLVSLHLPQDASRQKVPVNIWSWAYGNLGQVKGTNWTYTGKINHSKHCLT